MIGFSRIFYADRRKDLPLINTDDTDQENPNLETRRNGVSGGK
jgi:hypothetical protein